MRLLLFMSLYFNQACAKLTKNERDLVGIRSQPNFTFIAVVNFLRPSNGHFKMNGRTFTDGIVNLDKEDSDIGTPYNPGCQSALSMPVREYYKSCSLFGLKSKLKGENAQVINNWIYPLCEVPACQDISYNSANDLKEMVNSLN
jgi:hypothetical protein